MKKKSILNIVIFLVFTFMLVQPVFADGLISIKNIFTNKIVPAGGYIESDPIVLNGKNPDGFFSIQIYLTSSGSPTVKVEIYTSNDGVHYLIPSGNTAVTTGFTKTSGNGSDGRDMFPIELNMPVGYLKIRITETGGTDAGEITLDFCMQIK